METTLEILQQEIATLRAEVGRIKSFVAAQTNPRTYTVKQAAQLLGLRPAGVNFHIRKGNITPLNNKGRNKLITETELDRFIKTKQKAE